MGYDDSEYYNSFANDDSYHETCLKCSHEICDTNYSTNRVISALKNSFDWNCNGRCTQCDTTGITI